MIVSTILGTAAALFIARSSFVGRTALRAFFLSPVVLPGVVVGFCPLRVLYHQRTGHIAHDLGLVDWHILYSTPYVIGTVRIVGNIRCLARRGRAQPWCIAHARLSQDHFTQHLPGHSGGVNLCLLVNFGR